MQAIPCWSVDEILTLNRPIQEKECASTEGKLQPCRQTWWHNEASQTTAEVYSETAGYHWSLLPPETR